MNQNYDNYMTQRASTLLISLWGQKIIAYVPSLLIRRPTVPALFGLCYARICINFDC